VKTTRNIAKRKILSKLTPFSPTVLLLYRLLGQVGGSQITDFYVFFCSVLIAAVFLSFSSCYSLQPLLLFFVFIALAEQ
jgi:hypothetical protein